MGWFDGTDEESVEEGLRQQIKGLETRMADIIAEHADEKEMVQSTLTMTQMQLKQTLADLKESKAKVAELVSVTNTQDEELTSVKTELTEARIRMDTLRASADVFSTLTNDVDGGSEIKEVLQQKMAELETANAKAARGDELEAALAVKSKELVDAQATYQLLWPMCYHN